MTAPSHALCMQSGRQPWPEGVSGSVQIALVGAQSLCMARSNPYERSLAELSISWHIVLFISEEMKVIRSQPPHTSEAWSWWCCRAGGSRVLITTDVWARGLDVQQVCS